MSKEVFEISAQYGGRDAFKAVLPCFKRLKQVMKKQEGKEYCGGIEQFSFILRVDGDVQKFSFEGVERLDVNLTDRYISIDVGLPYVRWKGKSEKDILNYLRTTLLQGLNEMIACLKEKNMEFDERRLMEDFESSLADLNS